MSCASNIASDNARTALSIFSICFAGTLDGIFIFYLVVCVNVAGVGLLNCYLDDSPHKNPKHQNEQKNGQHADFKLVPIESKSPFHVFPYGLREQKAVTIPPRKSEALSSREARQLTVPAQPVREQLIRP